MISQRIEKSSFYQQHPSIFFILKWLIIATLVGLAVGSASAFFLTSLHWAENLRESNRWIIWLLPLAGMAVGMLYHYFGKNSDAGNNLLIETTMHPTGPRIPFRMAPLVLFGTIATHLFGGSAGREGTALQMAGAISDQLTRPLKLNHSDRKLLIIAAIAAGFGSVFGTPLAGAIFSLEVIVIGKMKYDAIFPAFLAAIIADHVTRVWGVGHTLFQQVAAPEIDTMNIIYSILAGIAFGLVAAVFSKLNHTMSFLFKRKVKYPPLRPFIGGLMIAIAVFAMGSTRYIGLGVPVIVEAFDQQLPFYDFAIKILFTTLTLGAGFKGGEVTPLFFIGATLGNALVWIIPLPMSLLAAMGFVAVFAGATNTPLACSVMAFELFGIESGIYVAIACVVAYLMSGNTSIYNGQFIGQPKHVSFGKYAGKRIKEI
ncbi:voltage-gated chloride channel family protein [Roseimarinus sediminis]|uniref:voltage-gated chloride channel family protein n=1 Tax=Roseimarinus sediminis TaxID=1610899 RepID=UPI003D1C83B6